MLTTVLKIKLAEGRIEVEIFNKEFLFSQIGNMEIIVYVFDKCSGFSENLYSRLLMIPVRV